MSEINWSFIDKIVFINLEQRPDRLASMMAELQKVNAPGEKILRFNAIKEINGALGCAKSHLNVLNMAQMNGWNNVLILEDDMIFENDSSSIKRTNVFFNELVQTNWDVGFLSASYFIIKKVKKNFYKVEFAYLANSYLVNKPYYNKLAHNYAQAISRLERGEPRNKVGLDTHWLTLMKEGNWFGVYPCIGYQKPGFSNIENIEIDRCDYFKRPLDDIKRYGSF